MLTACVADRHHGPTERIVEFSFPSGTGGLISFRTLRDGTDQVEVYRHDQNVRVSGGGWTDPAAKQEVRGGNNGD